MAPLCFFGAYEESRITIFNQKYTDQKWKDFFIKFLMDWSKVPLALENSSLVDFIDCLKLD